MSGKALRILVSLLLVLSMTPAAAYALPVQVGEEPAQNQELVALDLHLLQEGDYYWFSSPDELALEAQDTSTLSDATVAQFNAYVQQRLSDSANFQTVSGFSGYYVKLDVSGFNIGASTPNELQSQVSYLLSRAIYEEPSLFYGSGDALMSYDGPYSDMYWADTVYAQLAYTPDQIAAMQVDYEAAMTQMLSWIPLDATDAQKVKAVHDWLVRNCTYHPTAGHQTPQELGNRDPWNSYGALVTKLPVCEGFSLAFKDAMNRLGVEAQVVTQRLSNGEGHAWNRVKVDGAWYNLDITHDDGGTARTFDATPSTTYLLKSDAWFVANPSDGQWHTSWVPQGEAGTSAIYDEYTIDDWPTYSAPAPMVQAALAADRIVVAPGLTAQLQVTDVVPNRYDASSVTWASDDGGIATVSEDGVVTGIDWGATTITGTLNGGSATCDVVVKGGAFATMDMDLSLATTSFTYDGLPHTDVGLSVTATDPNGVFSTVLVEGEDYEVVWPDDAVNVGEKTFTVRGIGTFSGEETGTYRIDPAPIDGATVGVESPFTYAGVPAQPPITVTMPGDPGAVLAAGTDYAAVYSNNDGPGTGTVTVTGTGNYTGQASAQFQIARPPLEAFELSSSRLVIAPNGTGDLQVTNVQPAGATAEGAVWSSSATSIVTVDQSGHLTATAKMGSATVTCTINGVSRTCTVWVKGGTLGAIRVVPEITEYNGRQQRPTITVYPQGTQAFNLIAGEDYQIEWPDEMTLPGPRTIWVRGIGTFTGSRPVIWAIEGIHLSNYNVSLSADTFDYTGQAIEPEVTVWKPGETLVKDRDYVVRYENNVYPGTARVVISRAPDSNYGGVVTKTFTINALDPDLSGLDRAIAEATSLIYENDPKLRFSEDGADVPTSCYYVTNAEYNTFMLVRGESLGRRDSFTDQDSVDEMTSRLNAAIATFKAAHKQGTMLPPEAAPVTAAIDAAQAVLQDPDLKVSNDGSNVYADEKYVTPSDVAMLENEIERAREVALTPDLTEQQAQNAAQRLEYYTTLFEQAIKPGNAGKWERLWGSNALLTTQAVVQEGWEDGSCDTVVLATMSGYHDALAAASLAGAYNAPILLTRKSELSSAAAEEIERLGAETVIIVGGPAAVEEAVDRQVEELGATVKRVAGSNAQLTAVQIAGAAAEVKGASNTCIVATSKGYQDALAIAPYSYAYGAPIYLTNSKGQLRDEVAAEVDGYDHVIIVGGTSAIPQATEDQIAAMCPLVERKAGSNALVTANVIAQWCVEEVGMTPNKMGVATAGGYHDALAGAALCGRNNSVLVLVNKAGTNLYALDHFIKDSKQSIAHGYVFGGEKAVGPHVLTALEATTA